MVADLAGRLDTTVTCTCKCLPTSRSLHADLRIGNHAWLHAWLHASCASCREKGATSAPRHNDRAGSLLGRLSQLKLLKPTTAQVRYLRPQPLSTEVETMDSGGHGSVKATASGVRCKLG